MHWTLLRLDDYAFMFTDREPITDFEILVLALEDRRFFKHFGFDFKSIVRETLRALTFKAHGGASTIDMQLFRTVSNRYEVSIRRKIREIAGSFLLQFRIEKLILLRIYLEVAYFGTGLTGARQAASALFPHHFAEEYLVDISALSLDEAAQLAALLVYPKPRFPSSNWHAKVRRRANYALSLHAGCKEELKQSKI